MNEKKEKIEWADYLISGVRYEPGTGNSIIEYFKVHSDNVEEVGEVRTWSKSELLEALKNGKSIATIKKNSEGKWIKCNNISFFSLKEIFIRTDFKIIRGDNLGNLPEF